MSSQWIFLGGSFVRKEDAVVSVFDHGFLYGDGVFEGIRVYEGNVFKLDEHLERLYQSAQSIMLDIPYGKEEMQQIIVDTVKKNELTSAYIRVVISRGPGNLGLDPSSCSTPQIIVIAESLALFPKELYQRGLRIGSVASRRNRPDVLSPQVKSLNYLNNILVKLEANQAGVDEALMLNDQGYVTEGSADNIFIVKNGKIMTPPVYLGALEGITRNAIIDLAKKEGYTVEETPFTRHDVYVADEVFLTGTAVEVIAVVEADGRKINDGKPGEITDHLLDSFRKVVASDGVQCYDSKSQRAIVS
ncbi:branched-chain-amino-acid transaminase [Salisediminibacterium halotolerans]|uniref:branched-chain-amino-acid transaminase n=1 Tax=Salisediminibacterium halotolerans TaxID=517425 RepID=UPI000EB4DD5E|nr:branched-chain-amino-acid transaminase [Salisediminibacterium halotolerans]RLJ72360.1 branched-chain amino acid aminotransferase [Actinophytocola xinjiangensis]RPE85574.1 branched-chain amino acid aminotransferase [Salisediminibacterium halotolerans]TWG33529.1 branched-chain amino acid aminotransferase [Salisediminibacterium halotolerans]GEL08836.1 branched chain amino acid aminotransferase [Salisediminibacterium halotolerans]